MSSAEIFTQHASTKAIHKSLCFHKDLEFPISWFNNYIIRSAETPGSGIIDSAGEKNQEAPSSMII